MAEFYKTPMSGRCAILNAGKDAPEIITLEELPHWKAWRQGALERIWDCPSRLVLVGFVDDPEHPGQQMPMFKNEVISHSDAASYREIAEKIASEGRFNPTTKSQ